MMHAAVITRRVQRTNRPRSMFSRVLVTSRVLHLLGSGNCCILDSFVRIPPFPVRYLLRVVHRNQTVFYRSYTADVHLCHLRMILVRSRRRIRHDRCVDACLTTTTVLRLVPHPNYNTLMTDSLSLQRLRTSCFSFSSLYSADPTGIALHNSEYSSVLFSVTDNAVPLR